MGLRRHDFRMAGDKCLQADGAQVRAARAQEQQRQLMARFPALKGARVLG